MSTGTILFAQQVEEQPKGDKGAEPPAWATIVPWILVAFFWFYLMIILPNRRERQRQASLLGALKKNDEVLTTSGILGIVTSIKENGNEVTIKSDETRLRILKSSIAQIINPKESPAPAAAAAAAGQEQAITDLANKGKA